MNTINESPSKQQQQQHQQQIEQSKSPYKRTSNHPLAVSYDSNSNLNETISNKTTTDLIFSPKITLKHTTSHYIPPSHSSSSSCSLSISKKSYDKNELRFEVAKTRLQTSLKQPIINGCLHNNYNQIPDSSTPLNKSKKEVKFSESTKTSHSNSSYKRNKKQKQQQSSSTPTDDDDDNHHNSSYINDNHINNTCLSSSINTYKLSNESTHRKLRKTHSANSAFMNLTSRNSVEHESSSDESNNNRKTKNNCLKANNQSSSATIVSDSKGQIGPFIVQNYFSRINNPDRKLQLQQQQQKQQELIFLNETDEHEMAIHNNTSLKSNNTNSNNQSIPAPPVPPAPPILPIKQNNLIIIPIDRAKRVQSQDYLRPTSTTNTCTTITTTTTATTPTDDFNKTKSITSIKKIESTRLDDCMWPSTSEPSTIKISHNHHVNNNNLVISDKSANISTQTQFDLSSPQNDNISSIKNDSNEVEPSKFRNKFIVQKVIEDPIKKLDQISEQQQQQQTFKDDLKQPQQLFNVNNQQQQQQNQIDDSQKSENDSSKSDLRSSQKTDDENTLEERPIDKTPDNRFLKYDKEIGRGAFKTVYKGLDTESGVPIAWCELHDKKFNKQDRQRFKVEAEMLKQLQHPNIVRFYGSYESKKPRKIILITELMTSGTLKTYIQLFQPTKRLKIIKNFAYQILKGLIYLHSRSPPVIHRDLKLDNIFVTGNCGQVKIGDLGLATLKQQSFVKSVIGTPEFMAPEMYTESYDESVDVYAFGMCLLEMVTGEYPYQECTRVFDIYKLVTQGIKPENYKKVENKELRELIDVCINPKSNQRPTVKELANHSWFIENNGLNLDVVRDTKTFKIEHQDEKIIKFHLKTADRSKRRNPWPENEIIEFIFKVDEEIPEEVVKDLSEYGITEDDTRYLVQVIKDKCFIFKNERNDRKEESSNSTKDSSSSNDLNESTKNLKKLADAQSQQSKQQHDTLTAPTSMTTSVTQLQSTSTTQIPPANTLAATATATTSLNTTITSGYNSSVSTPTSVVDANLKKEQPNEQQISTSNQIQSQESTQTIQVNDAQNVNNQQKDEVDGINKKEPAVEAANKKPMIISVPSTSVSTSTITTTTTNISTNQTTIATTSTVTSSAKKPINKKSKDIKLTILDLVEVGEVVQCALESDDKKIEFKFGLNSDKPIDIVSKLIQAGVFKLAIEHTSRMALLLQESIDFINANKSQIQTYKNKTFMISIVDDKNKDFSETSETELTIDSQNGNSTSTTPTNQSNAPTPTSLEPNSQQQQQQQTYAAIVATQQQISPTNGTSLNLPNNNMKSNSNSNVNAASVANTRQAQTVKVSPIIVPTSEAIPSSQSAPPTAPIIQTSAQMSDSKQLTASNNSSQVSNEKPPVKPKVDEQKMEETQPNNENQKSTPNDLAEKLKEIFHKPAQSDSHQVQQQQPIATQNNSAVPTSSATNQQTQKAITQQQSTANLVQQQTTQVSRRNSVEIKDESKSPTKNVPTEAKPQSAAVIIEKKLDEIKVLPDKPKVVLGHQISLVEDDKLIEIQNRHRKEIEELLSRQKAEIEEFLMSKMYNSLNKNDSHTIFLKDEFINVK